MTTRRFFLSLLPASLASWLWPSSAESKLSRHDGSLIGPSTGEEVFSWMAPLQRAVQEINQKLQAEKAELKRQLAEMQPKPEESYIVIKGKRHDVAAGEDPVFAFQTMPELPDGDRYFGFSYEGMVAPGCRRAWKITAVVRSDATDEELSQLESELRLLPYEGSRVDTIRSELAIMVRAHQKGERYP